MEEHKLLLDKLKKGFETSPNFNTPKKVKLLNKKDAINYLLKTFSTTENRKQKTGNNNELIVIKRKTNVQLTHMETRLDNCEYCKKDFLPTRRKVQKFCATSCRVKSHYQKTKISNILTTSTLEKIYLKNLVLKK